MADAVSITRRRALQSIPACGLALIVPAAAEALPRVGTIAAMAEEHFALEDERLRIDREVDALHDQPGRPADPVLLAGEVDARYRRFDEEMFGSEESIKEYFGKRIEQMESSNYFAGAERYKATWAKRFREDRAKALAMFRDRSSVYENWRSRRGVTELERRSDALSARCGDLYDEIMDAPVPTIEDARDKANFIVRYFEHSEIPHDAAKRLVGSILTI